MLDRHQLIEEKILREHIQKILKKKKEKNIIKENVLRKFVQKIIQEAKVDSEIPHSSTGINVLEELLKKIIPIIEGGYKSLTTDIAQRTSYRAHIVSAIKGTLGPSKMKKEIDNKGASNLDNPIGEGNLDVKIGNDVEPDLEQDTKLNANAFIDIEKSDSEDDNFITLPGEDSTGRNMAAQIFTKIEKQIADSYAMLDNEEDENIFEDYLLVNVKMYCDRWEKELGESVEEPSSEIYDKEKTSSEENNSESLGM